MVETGRTYTHTTRRIDDDNEEPQTFIERLLIIGTIVFLVITFPISVWFCLRTLPEFQRAVLFRLGRIRKGPPKGPGVIFVLPCVDDVVRIDLRTATFDVPPQEILTRDSVTIRVDAVIYYRINDPRRSILTVERVHTSTKLLAQTTLRNVIGTQMLTELLSEKDTLSQAIKKILDDATDPWGVKVERVEMKNIQIPRSLQRALAIEAETVREAKAKFVSAEGEMNASRVLKEASDIMSQNEMTVQLRYLQTLTNICTERDTIVIFPFPVEFTHLSKDATGPKSAQPTKPDEEEVYLPVELQRAMAVEQEAYREAKAKIAAATGELQAAQSLKVASDVMMENPIAFELRYLQTMNTISSLKNRTIVVPLPIALLKKLMSTNDDK